MWTLKYSLFGLQHQRTLRLLWNLRLIKSGQFMTPSGEPYIGFKFTIGGDRAERSISDNNEMLQNVIKKWRREYFKERYEGVPPD